MVLAVTASKWLQIGPRNMTDQLEGNPVQRNVFMGLIAIGIVVLLARGQKVLTLLRMNGPILLFFSYGAISTLWSDFPDIAFKRWIKGLGDLVMVIIILTEPAGAIGIERFVARLGFLLVPISVLLIKYFPDLGMAYKSQDGRRVFEGITNDKNMLGVICLLIGLATVWRLLHGLRVRQRSSRNRVLIVHGAMLAMVLWLFYYANSMTSLACFALGSVLIVATGFPLLSRKPAVLHLLVLAILAVTSLALLPELGGSLVKTMGRDPTLTGRIDLWNEIVGMNGNPLFGTGFESFWMGPRLEKIWDLHWWHPNEAHNGYLEVFLNLGWTGVILLAVVILVAYRNSLKMLRCEPETGRLMLAFFVVGIIYSFTEAGFRLLNPVWICFMLASIAVPRSPLQTIAGTQGSLLSTRSQSVTPEEVDHPSVAVTSDRFKPVSESTGRWEERYPPIRQRGKR
jgi:exopolysaccharide production protein ExoQ